MTHLLHSKYLVIEVTLQLLIGKVNTKLFKTIMFEIFKAKNVQYANVELIKGGVRLQMPVESSHDPLKHSSIERLCQCITDISCLCASVSLVYLFTWRNLRCMDGDTEDCE